MNITAAKACVTASQDRLNALEFELYQLRQAALSEAQRGLADTARFDAAFEAQLSAVLRPLIPALLQAAKASALCQDDTAVTAAAIEQLRQFVEAAIADVENTRRQITAVSLSNVA